MVLCIGQKIIVGRYRAFDRRIIPNKKWRKKLKRAGLTENNQAVIKHFKDSISWREENGLRIFRF